MAHPTGAVVLLSGGIDSTVLLHRVAKTLRVSPIHAIAYDYGQRHVRELACAEWQANDAGVATFKTIELGFLRGVLSGASTLMADGADVPNLADLVEDETDQPPTYVPNRNMMLLSIAAAYAEANGIRDVYYGAQAQDEYGYWDCTADFLARINAVLSLNRRDAITVHAPLVNASKTDNVREGVQLGVDFAHTWSCYRGGEKPCDECPTCVERRTAFADAGVPDPLL